MKTFGILLGTWARNPWSYGILYSISSLQKGTAAVITQTVHSNHQILTAVSTISIVYPCLRTNLPLTSHSQALHANPTHLQCNHLHPCQIVGIVWYHARHANAKIETESKLFTTSQRIYGPFDLEKLLERDLRIAFIVRRHIRLSYAIVKRSRFLSPTRPW